MSGNTYIVLKVTSQFHGIHVGTCWVIKEAAEMARNWSSTLDNKRQLGTRFLVFLTEKQGQDAANALLAARSRDERLRMPKNI